MNRTMLGCGWGVFRRAVASPPGKQRARLLRFRATRRGEHRRGVPGSADFNQSPERGQRRAPEFGTGTVVLKWTLVPEADRCRVSINGSAADIESGTYTVTLPVSTYSWRAAAVKGALVSWSQETWQFTIREVIVPGGS